MSDLSPYEEGLAIDLATAQARIEELEKRNASLEAKLAKAVEIAELFSGGVEYDYHGNIIGDEERKAMAELEELTSSVAANNEVKGGKDE